MASLTQEAGPGGTSWPILSRLAVAIFCRPRGDPPLPEAAAGADGMIEALHVFGEFEAAIPEFRYTFRGSGGWHLP